MYDVDGNGVIDIQEMTKIVQVSKIFHNLMGNHYTYTMGIFNGAKHFGICRITIKTIR